MAPVSEGDAVAASPPASTVVRLEHVAEHVAQTLAGDVVTVIKADQRYAPLIGALAARVLAALAGV